MPRVFGAALFCLVVLQVLLALAFWAGYSWIGGAVAGVLVAVAALILLLLPWVGELTVGYDSQTRELNMKASWWGSARVRFTDPRELRVRLCGIPYRRELRKANPATRRSSPDRAEWVRLNLPDLIRFSLAALQALNEIALATKQMTLTLNAPTQVDALDQVFAGVTGKRTLGVCTLQALPEGARRVRVQYRVSLCTVVGAALFVLRQGRARKLLRSWRIARKIAR